MSLNKDFAVAKDLGVIAKKWFAEVERRFSEAGIESPVKTGVEGAASLLAPAALLAQLIKLEEPRAERPLRILVVTSDQLTVMDDGLWLGFAAELAGTLPLELFVTGTDPIRSSLHDAISQLGGPGHQPVTLSEAADLEPDLAVWVHPAFESGEQRDSLELIDTLYRAHTPIYACMYNELDALIQSHAINDIDLEFGWINGSLAGCTFSRDTVNRFAYSTAEAGIEGGWGAVLTKVRPASFSATPQDWSFITTAMNLFRLEGGGHAAWSFGQTIPGIAYNQHAPVGLIGNQAVDPDTGLMLTECAVTKVLLPIGHLWRELLEVMPTNQFQLVPWAAQVKLGFTTNLTKEDRKRADSVALLKQAFADGMLEAGIALARGLEATGTVRNKEEAASIYLQIGERHPMSAYFLAHDALVKGDETGLLKWLSIASASGYVPAITDLACIAYESGNTDQGVALFTKAVELGDHEAAFRLGEIQIKQGQYESALVMLRKAWSKGHAGALNAARWLCNEMLDHGLGKSGRLKREAKDIAFAFSKRIRLNEQVEKQSA